MPIYPRPSKAPLCLDSMINVNSSLQQGMQWIAPSNDGMSNDFESQQRDLEQAVIAGFKQFRPEPIMTQPQQNKFPLQLEQLILPGVDPRTMDNNFQNMDEYSFTMGNCNEEMVFSPGVSPCNH